MKNLKPHLWTVLAVFAMICYIIALFGIGFRNQNQLITLNDIGKEASKPFGLAYQRDSYGLMVSGMVFGSLFVMLALLRSVFTILNKNFFNKKIYIVDYVFVGMIIFNTILLLAGAGLYYDKTNGLLKIFNQSLNAGAGFGLFFLILLPLPLMVIPLIISRKLKKEA